MTHDPDPSAAAAGGADPLDETQPLETPRFAPAPDPRPDTRWAWAGQGPGPDSGWEAVARPAPVGPVTPGGPALRTGAEARGGGPGIATVVAVALLAAVLASSGTVLALGTAGALGPSAPAGTLPAPTAGAGSAAAGTSDESSVVISASARVSPAVVKITISAQPSDPFSDGTADGVGSGIIYDADGWILTNHHVVGDAGGTLTVETKDGRTLRGTVYGIDTLTDLAIVRVDAKGLPTAALGSSDGLQVGQLVIAVGSPLGTYSFSVTSGIVSARGRTVVASDGSTISNLIQTDAAINSGNAGGPLADADGNVVGINTLVADDSNGIGFAIPIDIAKPIMGQALRGEKLSRPFIGIRYLPIDQKVKAAQGLTVDSGALVQSADGSGTAITPGGPAEAAGLRDGDIITAINGTPIDQEHPLNLLLVQYAPNDTVRLTVLRGGQTLTVPLTLGVRPANLQ